MTPYARYSIGDQYKFSDDSQIGKISASNGNPSNYRFFRIEPIKWIVLNYKDISDKSLNGGDKELPGVKQGELYELLANDVLVSGVAPENMLWKNNTINTYLNNTMINEMFTLNAVRFAKPGIIYNNTDDTDSNLDTTGSNINYLADGFNSTIQQLYLLSRYEVANTAGPYAGTNKIFRNDSDRIEPGTDYARAHYLYLNVDNRNACWWVRTTNEINTYNVNTGGAIAIDNPLNINHLGTRPAMQGGQ